MPLTKMHLTLPSVQDPYRIDGHIDDIGICKMNYLSYLVSIKFRYKYDILLVLLFLAITLLVANLALKPTLSCTRMTPKLSAINTG